MKIKLFMTALLATIFFTSMNAKAWYNGEICEGNLVFTYNSDGSITVKDDYANEEVTYDSLDSLYMAMYGFIPPKTLAENETAQRLNIPMPNNNSNSSNKRRGRLIYTVQEANEVSKDGSVNKFRIRYK